MANAILNVGQTGGQVNISTAAAPATPAVGVVTLYAGTDKALHVKNSDGTDITIAAAGAASPITVQQTCSLVSTAIGATAAAGSNCAVVIGNNACTHGGASNSVVIGSGARHCSYGDKSVVIGCNANTGNTQTVVIGENANTVSASGIAIGSNASSFSNWFGAVALGPSSCAYADGAVDTSIGANSFSRFGALAVGYLSKACANKAISVGTESTVFCGATGTIVLGNSSVGGTGACNSVVIGNSARTTGADSIAIGDVAVTTAACAIAIGNAACSTATNGVAIGNGAISSGSCAIAIGNITASGSSIGIGANIFSLGSNTIGIGGSLYGGGSSTIMIGNDVAACNGGIAIGFQGTRATACNTVTIGNISSFNTHANSVLIGSNAAIGPNASGTHQVLIGQCNVIDTTGSCNTIIGGFNNCLTGTLSSVALIGLSGITGGQVRNNTTHVDSLVAFGQAASITNAVGSTGGTVTLNWNNSNIQTLTLTSSITTLTKSNPIDGAVYTLFLTQGGSGGYTVNFGADVDWAGGTGPTLSTAIGATDAVSLVYIAGITGYYGNANLNFA
jgi:hypothetical protein